MSVSVRVHLGALCAGLGREAGHGRGAPPSEAVASHGARSAAEVAARPALAALAAAGCLLGLAGCRATPPDPVKDCIGQWDSVADQLRGVMSTVNPATVRLFAATPRGESRRKLSVALSRAIAAREKAIADRLRAIRPPQAALPLHDATIELVDQLWTDQAAQTAALERGANHRELHELTDRQFKIEGSMEERVTAEEQKLKALVRRRAGP